MKCPDGLWDADVQVHGHLVRGGSTHSSIDQRREGSKPSNQAGNFLLLGGLYECV